jgi:hypothetical protein
MLDWVSVDTLAGPVECLAHFLHDSLVEQVSDFLGLAARLVWAQAQVPVEVEFYDPVLVHC